MMSDYYSQPTNWKLKRSICLNSIVGYIPHSNLFIVLHILEKVVGHAVNSIKTKSIARVFGKSCTEAILSACMLCLCMESIGYAVCW